LNALRSGLMEDYTRNLRQLKEIFPKHTTTTIDRALRENHNRLEPTITQLLKVPADVKGSPAPPPKPSAPAASRPTPAREAAPDHIFPPDFLRLPPDVEWMKVAVESGGPSALQTEDDILGVRRESSGEIRAMAQQPSQALQLGTIDPGNQESGWAKLKSRLLGSNPSYSHI